VSPDDASPTHFRPRPAVITASGQVVTFAQLEERSCRLAQALFAHGLRPGDHVAVLLPNDHRTHEVAWGAAALGPLLHDGQHAPDRRRGGLHRQRLRRPACSSRRSALAPWPRSCGRPHPGRGLRLAVGDPAAGTRPTTSSSRASPAEPLADEVEGSAMLYSSGTTGHGPRGSAAPHRAALRLRRRAGSPCWAGSWASAGDVYLSSGAALSLGPARVVHDGPAPGRHRRGHGALRPRATAWTSSPARVTHAQFVPTMFVRMLKLPDAARGRTTSPACARSCMPPRRARPRSSGG
jgi:long-chain acyl-CoA synthetase